MDWSNERYVRVYTRDTADYQVLSFHARGVWLELLRRADRSGVIATRHGAKGLAALIRWPADIVAEVLPELLADGCLQETVTPLGYVMPNYMPANEAAASDAQRKRDERERRGATANTGVTKRDSTDTKRDEMSRPSHNESRSVTPCLAVPSVPDLAVPSRPNQRESSLPASPAPAPVGPIEIHHDEDGAEVVWWGNPVPKAPEPKPPPKQRATKMAEDWSPGPAVVPNGVNPTTELEKFRDWCRARGQRYVDWQAAWRNWLRKAGEFSARMPKVREDGLQAVLRMAREGT